MSIIFSYIGIFLFFDLTVYDTQRQKNMVLPSPQASSPVW